MYNLFIGVKEVVNDSKVDKISKEQKDSLNLLQESFNVSYEDILYIYDRMHCLYLDYKEPLFSKSQKVMWSKDEDIFLMDYIEYYYSLIKSSNVKSKTKTVLFDELGFIFYGRTSGSVQFHYYELNKKPKLASINIFSKLDKYSFKEMVVSETNFNNLKEDNVFIEKTDGDGNDDKELDLLDMVVSIVDNVDDLGIDINGLFKGLLALTSEAVNKYELIELRESNSVLNEKISSLSSENIMLVKNVESLERKLSIVQNELDRFDKFSGKNKLRKIKDLRSSLNNVLKDNNYIEVRGTLNKDKKLGVIIKQDD